MFTNLLQQPVDGGPVGPVLWGDRQRSLILGPGSCHFLNEGTISVGRPLSTICGQLLLHIASMDRGRNTPLWQVSSYVNINRLRIGGVGGGGAPLYI